MEFTISLYADMLRTSGLEIYGAGDAPSPSHVRVTSTVLGLAEIVEVADRYCTSGAEGHCFGLGS